MANKKSAKKRTITNEKRRARNVARRSEIKTVSKKVLLALESADIEKARILLQEATSTIARAQGKGVLHKNTAARKIGQLAKKVHAVELGKNNAAR